MKIEPQKEPANRTTLAQIADLLARSRQQKAESVALRADLIKAAMSIGLTQEEAMKEKLETLLDGYLIGAGMNIERRKS